MRKQAQSLHAVSMANACNHLSCVSIFYNSIEIPVCFLSGSHWCQIHSLASLGWCGVVSYPCALVHAKLIAPSRSLAVSVANPPGWKPSTNPTLSHCTIYHAACSYTVIVKVPWQQRCCKFIAESTNKKPWIYSLPTHRILH